MTKKNKFFISLLALEIFLVLLGIFGIVYILIVSYREDKFLENVLPLIYFALHFAIMAFLIIMIIKAIKKESLILNTLCFDEGGQNIVGPKIFSGIAFSIGFILFVYFLLILVGIKLPGYQFSFGLSVDICYVSLTLFINALYFFIYPFIFSYIPVSSNKN